MDLRAVLLHRLVTPGTDNRYGQSYLVGDIVENEKCSPWHVNEALWGLVSEGLIYPDPAGQGQASTMDNWRWQLSQKGIAVASGGEWEPRQPDGYLRRLRRFQPSLDESILGYVAEALNAFNARCYLATSVMLGVASERAVNGVAEAVVPALGPKATKLDAAMTSPRTSQHGRFQELRKVLEPLRPQLPDDLSDSLTLDAIADLLRITRNDAGHPTGKTVDEDTAYTHLQMAARYLQKMAQLQAHFEALPRTPPGP